MSLKAAAQHLQSHGRGNDTMLIHMTPKEISGLQDLALAHGGSLTVNPHTGLPEAGFLDNILPLIAGVALNALVPGLGAAASGLLVGGATAAITGDMEKGLMAGLGAFGGSGIAGSLAKAGTSTAANAGINALDDVAINAARGGQDVSQALASSYAQPAQMAAQQGLAGAAQQTAQQGALGLPNIAGMGDRLAQMGQGVANIYNTPGAGGQFLKQNIMPIGAAALPMLGQPGLPKGAGREEDEDPTNPFLKRRLSPNFASSFPQQNYYTPSGLGYAHGGSIGKKLSDLPEQRLAPPGMYYGEGIARDYTNTSGLRADEAGQQMMEDNFKRARIKPHPKPRTNPIALAQGGLSAASSLGSYSDGGRLLKGPGDGMSDSIPASINGEQPARLGDGEFVVPADVVSHIGNGSTDAGARKLYQMMDEVRHARTGRKKQAPQINPNKYLAT